MHVVAEAQRNGGICAYIDAEHAMDPIYARAIGVDVDELLITQPDTGEQALEITDMLVRSGALDVVVIDSVAALTPRAEIEGEMGDTHVGLQARLMSPGAAQAHGQPQQVRTPSAIFINQLREKIGVMFGSPETTPGGRALKFYSSVRLDIRRIESIKDGVEVVGNRTRVKVVKNKVAPPFRQAEFDIMYGKGISREGSLLDIGVDLGIVKKSGAWYTYEGEQLGQGRENAKEFLTENPEIMVEISERIRARRPGIGRRRRARSHRSDDDADLPASRRDAGSRPTPPGQPRHPGCRRSGRASRSSTSPPLSNDPAAPVEADAAIVSSQVARRSVRTHTAWTIGTTRRASARGWAAPAGVALAVQLRLRVDVDWAHRAVTPSCWRSVMTARAWHGDRWVTGSPPIATAQLRRARPTTRASPPDGRIAPAGLSAARPSPTGGPVVDARLTSRPVTRTYLIRTFGCQMNEHDSERIAGLLEADGLAAGRRRSTTPTSSCSTPAASGRTPTTSSTAPSATSSR